MSAHVDPAVRQERLVCGDFVQLLFNLRLDDGWPYGLVPRGLVQRFGFLHVLRSV